MEANAINNKQSIDALGVKYDKLNDVAVELKTQYKDMKDDIKEQKKVSESTNNDIREIKDMMSDMKVQLALNKRGIEWNWKTISVIIFGMYMVGKLLLESVI